MILVRLLNWTSGSFQQMKAPFCSPDNIREYGLGERSTAPPCRRKVKGNEDKFNHLAVENVVVFFLAVVVVVVVVVVVLIVCRNCSLQI
jgi:hypothetical protein